MNKNTLNLVIFALSFIMIIMFVFPLLTGKGYPVFERPSILSMYKEYDQLQIDIEESQKLSEYSTRQWETYSKLSKDSKDKINDSLPKSIDLFRMLNDIMILVNKHKLSTKFPSHSVENSSSNPDIIIHTFTLTVSGDMYDFFRLLDDLYIAFPIYNYKSVSFSSNEKILEGETQSFTLTFETYQSKEKDANNSFNGKFNPNPNFNK